MTKFTKAPFFVAFFVCVHVDCHMKNPDFLHFIPGYEKSHSFFSNAALQVVDLIQGGDAVEVRMDVGELKLLKRSGESV